MSGPATRATVFRAALVVLVALHTPGLRVSRAQAQTSALPDYARESELLVGTPGTTRSIAGGIFNPAVWAVQGHGGLFFAADSLTGATPQRAKTFVLSTGGLGFTSRTFAGNQPGVAAQKLTDYSVGLCMGGRAGAIGVGYGWSHGHNIAPLRHERLTLGAVLRPHRYVSLGLAQTWDLNASGHSLQADLGFRPFGPRFTLFGDVSRTDRDAWKHARLGYGAELRPLPGLSIAAKAHGTGGFSLAVSADVLHGVRGTARPQYTTDGDHVQDGYSVELGTEGRSLIEHVRPRGRRIIEIDLGQAMTYQRYAAFDDRTAFAGVLTRLADAATDATVGGVLLRLSRTAMPGAMGWEIREQLRRLQASGKTVSIYADDLDTVTYMLACTADKLWLDPQGGVTLQGLAMGRTFYRGALDKLGVGVDEWRFFTYKSAMESLSRTSMSAADSTQRQNFVDDAYDVLAAAICESRGLTRAQYDAIVDHEIMVRPHAAIAQGLADTIGSYEEARADARHVTPRRTTAPAIAPLTNFGGAGAFAREEWGPHDRIALLYAVGPCDMDTIILPPVHAPLLS